MRQTLLQRAAEIVQRHTWAKWPLVVAFCVAFWSATAVARVMQSVGDAGHALERRLGTAHMP